MALERQRPASLTDPSTWCDYDTALAAVQAGHADGIAYVMTEADPFAAIELVHCRHPVTRSIDVWAQNFLDVARNTYTEVTPSGDGCMIWGLTGDGTAPVHQKYTVEIEGKQVAAELCRRVPKVLPITGYRLDTIEAMTSIDKVIDWARVWGERRTQANGHGSKVEVTASRHETTQAAALTKARAAADQHRARAAAARHRAHRRAGARRAGNYP